MKMLTTLACSLVVSLVACGDDALPTPPDRQTRDLPALVAPGPFETFDGGMPTDVLLDGPEPECCDVLFAVAADTTVTEVGARLVGSRAPLDGEGVTLSLESAAWTATVCMPIGYDGSYHYQVDLESDSGATIFTETRVNPNAASTDTALGSVNLFPQVDDCSADFSSHADTTPLAE